MRTSHPLYFNNNHPAHHEKALSPTVSESTCCALSGNKSLKEVRVFKKHLIRLKDEGLAPATINQHAASMHFLFIEVLEIKPHEGLRIRLKTGKPLPMIHSKDNIGCIMRVPRNPTASADADVSLWVWSVIEEECGICCEKISICSGKWY